MGSNFVVVPGASNGEEMYYYDIEKQFKVIVDFLKFNSSTCGIVLGLNCPNKDYEPLHDCVRTDNGAA